MSCAVAAFVAVILASSMAPAVAVTGTQLYESCQGKARGAALDLSCAAYVRGLVEGLQLGRHLGMHAPKLYCPPKDGLDPQQARLIIEKYLRDHPERLHENSSFLGMDALMGAFPCKD
jgi:Rap1a immunity proteins